jgi:choline kinase
MKALIIAAGLGSRLSGKGNSKPLIELNGIPLIQRVISTLKTGGVSEFFVVVGYNSKPLEKFLLGLKSQLEIEITTIFNPDWKEPNGISVLKAKNYIKENFILTMTDHIYESTIIERLIKTNLNSDEVMLVVDYNVKNNSLVDIDDVTKVSTQNGFINDIGKEISNFNAFDTGIFYSSTALFDALEKALNLGKKSLSEGIKILATDGKVRSFDVEDDFWIDVDDDNAFEKALKILNREM